MQTGEKQEEGDGQTDQSIKRMDMQNVEINRQRETDRPNYKANGHSDSGEKQVEGDGQTDQRIKRMDM